MSVIFDELRKSQQQAEAVVADPTKEPGAAHQEWIEARGIDELELDSLLALMAVGMPVQQAVRIMYEAGYRSGAKAANTGSII